MNKEKYGDNMMTDSDSKQAIFIIGVQGKEIKNVEQLMQELSKIVNEGSIYRYSKETGLGKGTLHKIKNNELQDPRISTVLKLLKASGKRLVIIDEW
ncbi:hypothetical protein MJ_0333 [Methanocaldococcus jannaschii DSM 2661]|uniref:Uncharacterized protein MJ0333 n=2 Tax=Methanocaldococcus jannaschii TaxID=2190 RepID=Y333_METJA|nr:RecName: Full=Uncharacterized protein MJ0333 [Methanocaldococcus jannaschii DSM 2661]AAB98321.1 hypothetical protein MJ_0333 [Methanocaldococcus jannaschii DSM 2661]